MKVYEPKISVKLVKAVRRDKEGIAPGVPVAERYGNVIAVDLTPWLGDSGVVQTSKSVREPAGGFTITLADKSHPGLLDSIYALVEPMDLIEIKFCRDPSSYGSGKWPPIVMRGLVTAVTRNEAMQGGNGKPSRAVVIQGQDFGKILQIMQVYYLYENGVMATGSNVLSEFAFFAEYAAAGDAKIKSAKEFVGDVMDRIINPQLKKITSLADGAAVSAKVINEWSSSVTIDGAVTPFAVSSLYNVSLHSFLSSLLDVGPFNEMFVEDTEDGVRLVVRPAPFKTLDGRLIQGADPGGTTISDGDIVEASLSRTDQGVANYFWVSNSRFPLISNDDQRALAAEGERDSFILFDYLNSKSAYYGPRKMEVASSLVDPAYGNSDAPAKDEVQPEANRFSAWLSKRRKALADMNKDNVVFESGTMRVKGNERLKAGTYLTVKRGDTESTFYIVKVDHSFAPFSGFMSTLTLERGTSYFGRARDKQPRYLREMNVEGVR